MNATAIERFIANISWSCIPVTVRTHDGALLPLLLRPPTPKESALASRAYSTEYQRAIISGLQTENDVLEHLKVLGQFNPKTDMQIDLLKNEIHNIRRGLLSLVFNKTKLEHSRSLLRRAELALSQKLEAKYKLTSNSAEAHALTCQQRHIISCVTQNENGSQFWSTDHDFDSYTDVSVIIELCDLLFMKSRISVKNIREISRSQQWKMYWEISKNTNDLFDGPVSTWSHNQKELAYWSSVYDSVYGAYERPSQEVIDDDDLLDSWFINQGEKVNLRTTTNGHKPPPKGKHGGRREEFIVTDAAGAKSVYSMNDMVSRAKVRAKQQLVNKSGVLKDQDAPDSQNEMRLQLKR